MQGCGKSRERQARIMEAYIDESEGQYNYLGGSVQHMVVGMKSVRMRKASHGKQGDRGSEALTAEKEISEQNEVWDGPRGGQKPVTGHCGEDRLELESVAVSYRSDLGLSQGVLEV